MCWQFVCSFFRYCTWHFAKYFNDLFRVFFRTTLKQRQIKEQLMQTPLPSFAFNIFFIASAGLYADFLLFHFGIEPVRNFWLLYCVLWSRSVYYLFYQIFLAEAMRLVV